MNLHPYGIPRTVTTLAWFDPGGFTWGNDIYLTRGGFDLDNLTDSNIVLIAHELAHVAQFDRLGKEYFAKQYAFWAMLGRMRYPLDGYKETYAFNPLEWEAIAFQDLAGKYLDERIEESGKSPCQ